MYVAVRQRSHAAWVVVDERAPDRDAVESGVVVPIGEITELVPAFPAPLDDFELPETRVLDLVGVDTRGRITLALCRVGATAGVTQHCVARLLELAASLRRARPFAEIESRVEAIHGRPLVEVVRERLPEGEAFDESQFAERFAHDAATGRFRVTLAALAVSPELDAILDIVDDPTDELLQFEPVEMAAFDFGPWHVGQPRVRGDVLPGLELAPETGPTGRPGDADACEERAGDAGVEWDHLLDSLRDEDPLPFESIEDLERFSDELEGEDAMDRADAEYGFDDASDLAPPDVVLSIAGRRHDEDAFFESLESRSGRTVVQRVRRLLELGREPARTLPAGWIVSREALSFQAGLLRERVSPPEPVVAEILRVDTAGQLTIDLPLLRILLAGDSVSLFLRDLQTSNPLLRLALGPGDERSVLRVDDVFDSDFDVRSFCVAVRKLVLGVGLVGGHGGREAA